MEILKRKASPDEKPDTNNGRRYVPLPGKQYRGILFRRILHTLIFLAVTRLASTGKAQSTGGTRLTEYQVKAAFLFNFAKFVEWPASAFAIADQPITICIKGKDPFGKVLEQTVSNKTINGRKIVVKRSSQDDMSECQILFISSSEQDRLPQILKSLNGKSILTVADMNGFLQAGGMINLILVDDKIRFEINYAAALKVGLKKSSQLLRLAENSKDSTPPEVN